MEALEFPYFSSPSQATDIAYIFSQSQNQLLVDSSIGYLFIGLGGGLLLGALSFGLSFAFSVVLKSANTAVR